MLNETQELVNQLRSQLGDAQEKLGETHVQLGAAQERTAHLEQELSGKGGEIETLRNDLNQRSENMSQAGDRVRDLVSRLEAALV